jgi:hypothetical protein
MSMNTTPTCLNCEHRLAHQNDFCPKCGQSAHIHRIDMHHILHDVVHAFLHADKGILHLTKELALRPGYTAKSYIAGQRKRYFNPFSYLVISVAISAFLVHSLHLLENDISRGNLGTDLASKYFNWIMFAGIPITALFSWWLFRKSGYNYAENLTLHAFLGGFRIVFFVLIFTPLVVLFRQHYYAMLMVYMLLWAMFAGWAKVQFFGGPVWLTLLKTILALALTQLVLSIIIGFIVYLKVVHK